MMKQNQIKDAAPKRSVHLDVRFTPEEKNQVLHTADQCGLSLSNYVRKRALNYQPKARLSQKEAEALASLCTVRGDVVHVKNALTGLSKQERARLLYGKDFLFSWLEAVTKIINRWNQIIKSLQS
jgi:hypothetical protein